MKTALVTGGSEGIGLAFAHYLSARGYSLILASRTLARLQEASTQLSTPCKVIPIDLSLSGAAHRLYKDAGTVDLLVNCAGTGYTGISWQEDIASIERLINLNDTACVSLCSLYLREMTMRRSGMIINVASTGAFQPGPYIAAYYASKSFIASYSKAIAIEARPYGVKVVCLCPGPCDTGFYDKTHGIKPAFAMRPEEVVDYCMRHLHQTIIVPGAMNRLALLAPLSLRTYFIHRSKRSQLKSNP